jgi:outer membrane receptor protein involved in Fe transport
LLTYIGSYSEYESELGIDVDFASFPGLFSEGGDDFDQTSHELRIASVDTDGFEYVAGLFLMSRNFAIPNWQLHADFDQYPPPLVPKTRLRVYDEDTDTVSVFAQGTYDFTDALSVTLGVRYNEEDKKATSRSENYELGNVSGATRLAPDQAAPYPEYTFAGDRSETSLTPSLSIQYELDEEVNLYASYNEAEKSGGFNSNSASSAGIEYDEESAAGIEVGAKMLLLDNSLRLNVALFSTEFDDYQVSSFDGVNQTVNNAATTETRGVEVEVDWAATENLTLGAALAYLDAEYTDFENAPCAPVNQADCVNGDFRDASGERITFAPEYSGSVYATYIQPITGDLDLRLRLTAAFSDEYDTQLDKSEPTIAESYVLVNARAAIAKQDGSWEVAVIGSNLTDERLFNFAGNLPLFSGAHFANTRPPRLITLEGIVRF